MSLITLDFWGYTLIAFYAGLLLVSFRIVGWLATGSERVLALLTQTGLHGMAKGLLAVLIGYDEHTYRKSRFILWNQARVRFALLWGSSLLLAGLLWLAYLLHFIDSVGLAWTTTAIVYVGFRCLTYWTRPKTPRIITREPSLKSLIQNVNEQAPRERWPDRQLIRRYDYLDELFSAPV